MNDVQVIGCGLGFREEIASAVYAAADSLDFVEVMTEGYMWREEARDSLRRLADRFTVIPHGVGLSVGTVGPVDAEYLRGVRRVCEVIKPPYFSDHLAMTRVPGIDLGHLAPIRFTHDLLRSVIDTVDNVQQELGRRLILENVTYLFDIPGAQMSQPEFFHRLVDATSCGILFDVTNLYTNSVNHHFDPAVFMDEMPLDHVVQVHLAGGAWDRGMLVDSHSQPVEPAVWDLFARLCKRSDVKAVLLEHDQNFPDFSVLVDQVRKAHEIFTAARQYRDLRTTVRGR